MKRAEAKAYTTEAAAPEPETLKELGVPGPLASELEAVLHVAGKSGEDGRIVGYRFVTPDGVSHELCMGERGRSPGREADPAAVGLAARAA